MPPSPKHPRFLLGKKLKQPASPNVPTLRLPQEAPRAWAQSSTTNNPRRRAISMIAFTASMPERFGITMSIMMTSGCSSLNFSTTSTPSVASPTTS